MMKINQNFFKKNQKGFTLIEMLVSIALFSIVLVIVLGTIMTIVDINRKTRTLTEIINNLNFALDSMNRTLITGRNFEIGPISNEYIGVKDQNGKKVCFKYLETSKAIGRYVNENSNAPCASSENDYTALTSSDVVINKFYFKSDGDIGNIGQPMVHFLVQGYVETIRDIKSEFSIQTSVSQRNPDTTNVGI